jgi:Zn-dependent protease with chaperone function
MAPISLPDLRSYSLSGLTKNLFPCVSRKHLEISNIFFKCSFVASLGLHTIIHPIAYAISTSYSFINQTIFKLFSYIFTANIQISKFTGRYEFFLVPKIIEKWVATNLIHPLYTFDIKKSFQRHNRQPFDLMIGRIFDKLVRHNPDLISQNSLSGFKYSFEIFDSSEVQIFSLPAGKILISSKFLQELSAAIKSKAINKTEVSLKDGSVISINLSTCNIEDVLSALMGHEITHVEASHSIQEMGYHLFSAFLKSMLELFKPSSNTIPSMYIPLLSEVFLAIYHLFHALFFKRHSRTFEYTCDIAAIYMQKNAAYNPLGSLYLMEFLNQLGSKKERFFLNHFEFLYSHPSFENRKTALAYCVEKLSPSLIQYFETQKISEKYDERIEADGILMAKNLISKIRRNDEELQGHHQAAVANFAV